MTPPTSLDWTDRDAVRAWLAALAATATDLIAVAEDMTEPPARRELGRSLAATLTAESASGLEALIAFALRGLAADDDGEPDSGDPAGSGDAGAMH